MAAAAAMAATAAGRASLAASYAAVQTSLCKQFYGDLVELRGALLNTMNLAPDRAASLHPKMNLIDLALDMLEETKGSVTNAEMTQLMIMSAKVACVVEAWRSRKPPLRAGASTASVQAPGIMHGAAAVVTLFSSPFAAPEVQGAARASPAAAGAGAAAAGSAGVKDEPESVNGGQELGFASVDRFDVLMKLISGSPGGPTYFSSATLLPVIDWEVPEIKPSGNLDALLPSEASEVLLQQCVVACAVAHVNTARVSSTEAVLAHFTAHVDDTSVGGGDGQQAQQAAQHKFQRFLCRGLSPSQDSGMLGLGASTPSGPSALTSLFGQAAQQQEAGSNDSGSGGGAAAAGGSTAALSSGLSPAPQHAQHTQQQQLLRGQGAAYPPSPFASSMLSGWQAGPPWHSANSANPFASIQMATQGSSSGYGAALLTQQHLQQQAAAAGMQAGGSMGFGFGDAGSLPLSHTSHGVGSSQLSSLSGLVGMQQLGLGHGGSLPLLLLPMPAPAPPPRALPAAGLPAAAAHCTGTTRGLRTLLAAGDAAAGAGGAAAGWRLRAIQQFPHAALNAGSSGLARLLSGGAGESSNYAHLVQHLAFSQQQFPPIASPHLHLHHHRHHQQAAAQQQEHSGQAHSLEHQHTRHAYSHHPQHQLQHSSQPGNVVSGANFTGVTLANAGSVGAHVITTGTQKICIAQAGGACPSSVEGYGDDGTGGHHLHSFSHQSLPSPKTTMGVNSSSGSLGNPHASLKRKRG